MNITLTPLDFLAIAAIVWIFARRSYPTETRGTSQDLRLRRQVDAIMKHLGLPEPPTSSAERLSPQVLELVAKGRKIEAIRLYREETGESLKQARNAIEARSAAASAGH